MKCNETGGRKALRTSDRSKNHKETSLNEITVVLNWRLQTGGVKERAVTEQTDASHFCLRH